MFIIDWLLNIGAFIVFLIIVLGFWATYGRGIHDVIKNNDIREMSKRR